MTLTSAQLDFIRTMLRGRGAVVGYLFGSYARGTAGPLSDLDVGVIFPSTMSREIQDNTIEDIRGDLERLYGRDKVDVINVPHVKSPLLRYIITLGEGQVLFSDDVSIQNKFASYSLREYENTQHIRNIQSKAIRRIFA